MSQAFDARKSGKPFDQSRNLVAVIEMSQESWLVGGMVPGLQRRPPKKLSPEKEKLLALLLRWRDEALRTGRETDRIAVACESGRDGFWLVRWLRAKALKPMSFMPPALLFRASTAGPRPTGLTPRCSGLTLRC